MLVTIGIICILLTSVMFVQFKTVQVIEESGVGAKSEARLKADSAELTEKIDEKKKDLDEIQKGIDDLENNSNDQGAIIELLKSDIKKANCDLGYTDVKGPGLIITISDGDNTEYDGEESVMYYDLLFAVNELKYAGAEAISVEDVRVVNNTFITKIDGRFLMIDGTRMESPYTIKVIGDTKYLESVINIKGGLKDEMESGGKKVSYTVENEVYINKYDGLIEINYGE